MDPIDCLEADVNAADLNKVSKRRSKNFTQAETYSLLALVRKYRHYLECKRNDSKTNRLKRLAWMRIAAELNSTTYCNQYRTANVLRVKYENLKKQAKSGILFKSEPQIDPRKFRFLANGIDGDWDGGDEESNAAFGEEVSEKGDDGKNLGNLEDSADSKKKHGEKWADSGATSSAQAEWVDMDTFELSSNETENNESPPSNYRERTQAIKQEHPDSAFEDTAETQLEDFPNKPPTAINKPGVLQTFLVSPGIRFSRNKRSLQNIRPRPSDSSNCLHKSCAVNNEHVMKLKHAEEVHKMSLRHMEEMHQEKLRAMKEEHQVKMEILRLQLKRAK